MHTHLHQYVSAIETLQRIEAVMKSRNICPTHVECAISTMLSNDELGEDQVCRYIHSAYIKDFPFEISWVLAHGEANDSLNVTFELEFNESNEIKDHFSLTVRQSLQTAEWTVFVEPLFDQKIPGKPCADLQRLMEQWNVEAGKPKQFPAIVAWSMISQAGDLFAERLHAFQD